MQIDNLSDTERQIALQILQQYADEGNSKTYNSIIDQDYKELPVDIITFVLDDRYLGKAWHSSDGTSKLFPFWEEQLKKLFPDPFRTNFNNFIETGARGLGKSEIAVTCALYLMHRLLCLKNPHDYYGLKATEKFAFAFMNITKDLAEDIGISKFQSTVKLSPWFLQRGTITGRTEQVWNPPDFIDIIVGSQARQVIGQPIFFCLDGDTLIFTDKGIHKIKDLVDDKIKVPTVDNNNNIVMSETCTVKQTGLFQEEYEIELEDGSIIKCTPNHRFMLKDGSYKEAQYLTQDDELMDFTSKQVAME